MIFFKETIRINEKGEDEKTIRGKGDSVKFPPHTHYYYCLLGGRKSINLYKHIIITCYYYARRKHNFLLSLSLQFHHHQPRKEKYSDTHFYPALFFLYGCGEAFKEYKNGKVKRYLWFSLKENIRILWFYKKIYAYLHICICRYTYKQNLHTTLWTVNWTKAIESYFFPISAKLHTQVSSNKRRLLRRKKEVEEKLEKKFVTLNNSIIS